jgi:hypothetical protein
LKASIARQTQNSYTEMYLNEILIAATSRKMLNKTIQSCNIKLQQHQLEMSLVKAEHSQWQGYTLHQGGLSVHRTQAIKAFDLCMEYRTNYSMVIMREMLDKAEFVFSLHSEKLQLLQEVRRNA